MKVREPIGTTVRTMVKVNVTTDGDQHQDEGEGDYRWGPASGHGESDYGSMGERRTSTRVSTRGYRQRGHDLRCNGL